MPSATETRLWDTLTDGQWSLLRDGAVTIAVERKTGGLIAHHALTGLDGYGQSPRLAVEAMAKRIKREGSF